MVRQNPAGTCSPIRIIAASPSALPPTESTIPSPISARSIVTVANSSRACRGVVIRGNPSDRTDSVADQASRRSKIRPYAADWLTTRKFALAGAVSLRTPRAVSAVADFTPWASPSTCRGLASLARCRAEGILNRGPRGPRWPLIGKRLFRLGRAVELPVRMFLILARRAGCR